MFPSVSKYRRELESVAQQLKPVVSLVEIRGKGAGQFIYTQYGARALELSRCDEGIWIEFWDGTDEYESPAKELTVSSYDEAIVAVIDWLNPT